MANRIIECPFCEVRLSISNTLTQLVLTCPSCKHSFDQAEAPEATEALSSSTKPEGKSTMLAPEALVEFDQTIIRYPAHAVVQNRNQTQDDKPEAEAREPLVSPQGGIGKGSQSSAVMSPGQPPHSKAIASPSSEMVSDKVKVAPTPNTFAVKPGLADTPPRLASATTLPLSDDSGTNAELSEIQLAKLDDGSGHSIISQRKKEQRLVFFVINSILAMLTLFFGVFLYWKITSQPGVTDYEAVENRSATAIEAVGAQDAEPKSVPNQTAVTIAAENASIQELQPTPPVAVVPPVRPAFQFFSKNQVADTWKETKPNLVSLEIEGPRGKQRAVGTIIDSRGWIITSHQAVQDAWKIEVKAATEPLDKPAGEPPLSDLVRGHVANDPTHDLAILAINRRFVVSLAELKITQTNRLVPVTRLLSLAPPTGSNYYGVCEVIIDQRSNVDDLSLETKSKIRVLGIGSSELSWLTMRGKTEWLPGTPLIDQSGIMQAMVSFSQNGEGYAVPLDFLPSLIKRATGTITPLKSPAHQTIEGVAVPLGISHPARKTIVDIQMSASLCREFDWLPTTEGQYQRLVGFFRHYLAGKDYVMANPVDYRESAESVAAREGIETLINQMQDEIFSRLQQALKDVDSRLHSMNRLAEQEFKKDEARLIPLYGQVHSGGLQLDQFIVQIHGSETLCVFPFDPTARVMRPGTDWLVVAETNSPNQPKAIQFGQGRSIRAYPAFQRTEIGPVE